VIAAGLLHDIMDDSYDEYSNKRLAEMFGKEVADLVEGVYDYRKNVYASRD
jgi:(p)ppGpp synthase/HD superfamily hydrolase